MDDERHLGPAGKDLRPVDNVEESGASEEETPEETEQLAPPPEESLPRRITIKYHPPHDYLLGWSARDARQSSSPEKASGPLRPALLSRGGRVGVLLVLWFIVLGASLTTSGRSAEMRTSLPDGIFGLWRTVAPKYEDSFIEISNRSLVLGADDGHRVLHPVDHVTQRPEQRGVRYTLWYRPAEDPGDLQPFRVHFNPSRQRLWLDSQLDIVWEHVGPWGLEQMVTEIEESSQDYENRYGHLTIAGPASDTDDQEPGE